MAALGPGRCVIAHALLWLAVASAVSAQRQGPDAVAPRDVEIVKQINRMNEDGSYTFGYEAADGSFKIETRDVAGNVKGMFGFVDETGELKRVSYTASNGTGFKPGADVAVPTVAYTTAPPGYTTTASSRPAILLGGGGGVEAETGSRAPVIQHIPRRAGSSTTTPSYGEYLKGRRTHIVLPNAAAASPAVTEESESDEPPQPLRKLLVAKRPVTSRGGNALRRQLGADAGGSGGGEADAADVYSGAAAPRFVPAQSVRSPQSSLLANLPPHVAAAIRQQQIARAAASLRPVPAVLDEQEYPVATPRLPVRAIYRPVQEPTSPIFPVDSLRTLRDELMDYILQYVQYRLSGGVPYPAGGGFGFNSPPAIGYPGPLGYPGAAPYNPYLYPGPPYGARPYQFPGAYPGPYPGQGFPQPLPFSSPNKQLQQTGRQYAQAERSADYDGRGPTAQQYQEADGRGSSGEAAYTLPPADVLRMMLARGLAAAASTTAAPTPASGPVRSVQILGAASDASAATAVRPPPAPRDRMEMQA